MKRRLPVRELPPEGGAVRLDPAALRHAKVLRLGEGDAVTLFDGSGLEAEATITHIGREMVCEVGAPLARPRTGPRVVLCQCMPKGGKLEDIVRATTELGVAAVHLVSSERSVPRLEEGRAEKRMDRLARVATEAARQSGRAEVPDLVAPAPLEDVLARAPVDAVRLVLVPGEPAPLESAFPSGGARPPRLALRARTPPDLLGALDERVAWVLVGPEGGLSAAELEAARAAGFVAIGLGAAVLRVETAAPVSVALVTHLLGGLRS